MDWLIDKVCDLKEEGNEDRRGQVFLDAAATHRLNTGVFSRMLRAMCA